MDLFFCNLRPFYSNLVLGANNPLKQRVRAGLVAILGLATGFEVQKYQTFKPNMLFFVDLSHTFRRMAPFLYMERWGGISNSHFENNQVS